MASKVPDPNALRRERPSDIASWTDLPAGAKVSPAPAWCLVGSTDRELELWAYYWNKPQAILWQRNRQEMEVALFVRNLAIAELPGLGVVTLQTLLLKQMENLLLTIPAMYKARVKIVADQVSVKRATKATAKSAKGNGSTMKDRLKVVQSSGA